LENITSAIQGHGLEIACIVGLLIVIVGFGLVLWRIRKLEMASEGARKAAETIHEQFLRISAMGGLGSAINNLEQLKRSRLVGSGAVAPDQYASLKHDLIAVRGRMTNLTDQQRSTIQGAIQQISNIEEHVTNAAANGDAMALHRVNLVISRQVDRLADILAELRNKIDLPRR
jgi:hypothetical protein